MMVVGAAAVGRGISETGKIEMDGQMGRGVHNISNKKFLLILLSWKKKKKKRGQRPKKWSEFLVVASPLSLVEPHSKAVLRPRTSCQERKHAQGQQNRPRVASLFVSSQQTSKHTTHARRREDLLSTHGHLCYSLPIKGFARSQGTNHISQRCLFCKCSPIVIRLAS